MEDFDEPTTVVEAPLNQLPDLTLLDIPEHSRGVCEDSYENRRILRRHKYSWVSVFDSDGQPTNLLQAISPEMLEAKSQTSLADKSFLLDNPNNRNSDYVTGINLIITPNIDDFVPAWVIASTRLWVKVERAREEGKKAKPALVGPPGRCAAIRENGVRCQFWHAGTVTAGDYCRLHLGSRLQREANVVEHARNRIKSAAMAAVDTLEQLMDSAESEPVRLNASKELLDRAGIRGGVEVDTNIHLDERSAGELIAERLAAIREKSEQDEQRRLELEANTVDAEVVEDE